MNTNLIYLDHHATTPVRPQVLEAMRPWLSDSFGNASSAHAVGRRARQALESAREVIAKCLGAFPDEVIFTSGATESNNLAVFGLASDPTTRIITSAIEHPCVIEPIRHLEKRGHVVTWLPVTSEGVSTPLPLREGPGEGNQSSIVVLMTTNHETGAIQNSVAGTNLWHCDAAQAAGKRPIDFHALGATTLSISGHKFGGPQGIGALLVCRGENIKPMMFGGHQQRGLRPGTEPVALAVGMAEALRSSLEYWQANHEHVSTLRDRLARRLQRDAGPCVINGPKDKDRQSPYVLNISFPGLRADALLMALDLAGVACSTGSACSSGSLLPSPVLQAMGVPEDVLRSAMRFSFSPTQTEAEIDEAADRIVAAFERLRATK